MKGIFKRRQLMVDPEAQGRLSWRPVAYWLVAPLALLIFALLWALEMGNEAPLDLASFAFWRTFALASGFSLLIIPWILYDLMVVSNRMLGPNVRLRRALQDLAQGRIPKPLDPRQGDYSQNLFGDFNTALAMFRMQNAGVCKASDAKDEEELRSRIEVASR